jgi:hypothetical protein
MPPPSSTYEVVDSQVYVPPSAKARKGIQPVVTLTANGAERATVAVGETVQFWAIAEVPPATGTIVAAEWDFEGGGDYPLVESEFEEGGGAFSEMTFAASYAFNQPGTYFPALRITSQRQGDPNTSYGRVQNLGRVRVVVQ